MRSPCVRWAGAAERGEGAQLVGINNGKVGLRAMTAVFVYFFVWRNALWLSRLQLHRRACGREKGEEEEGDGGKKKIITLKLQSHSSRDRECVCDVQRARFYGPNGISISPYTRYDILYYSCNTPAGTCIVSAQQWAVISSHFMVPYTVCYHCNIRGLSSTCVV